ncbi:transcription factor BIM2-like isoform X2 [Papaver somniferum]|uniref:transcription factor BIM2-like isoform X2 n=1 Tax=Papaver somniferum TaxID=3469 RepID=UPI000E6F9E9A|nr:transcription factor BIM2-like isoform X2 [Papaver somniferum]
MELSQSCSFGTEGKKPTHDFLSLYNNHSSFQHQDPRPSQGIYLKTRDFLQPLETVEKSISKGESSSIVETSSSSPVIIEKKAISQPRPPSSSSSASSIEHVLPGGIGTYTISHIPNFGQQQVVPGQERPTSSSVIAPAAPTTSYEKKTDVVVNNRAAVSNSNSSYSGGSSFTLWGDSVVEKKASSLAMMSKNGSSNGDHGQALRESVHNLGKWSSEQSLPSNPYILPSSFNSLPSSKGMSQKNQSFMEMMKSAKSLHEDDDDDEIYLGKRDISSQKELTVKVDSKNIDQKANTPRSKHSATEQRRRSKINDRFQILREIIPLNDQKRDKASFLLEVIEYIQFLQEKVTKYEGPYQGWNQEQTKLMPWRNRNRTGENMADHSRVVKNVPGPGMIFGGKFNDPNIPISSTLVGNAHNVVENDLTPGVSYKPMEPHLGRANKALPLPVPIRPELFTPAGDLAQPIQRPTLDEANLATGAESHLRQSRPCGVAATDVLKERDEMAVEGGTISISNVYSQGLLNNLTKALQSSGVDLSQASISVQIDLGKQRLAASKPLLDHTNPSHSNQTNSCSRNLNCGEDSNQAQKRLKIENS